MHTFYGSKGTVFVSNSDMSGGTIIIGSDKTEKQLEIPAYDILEFVAEYVRKQRMSKIERTGVLELLDL